MVFNLANLLIFTDRDKKISTIFSTLFLICELQAEYLEISNK